MTNKPWEGKHWIEASNRVRAKIIASELIEAGAINWTAYQLEAALKQDWEESQKNDRCECGFIYPEGFVDAMCCNCGRLR